MLLIYNYDNIIFERYGRNDLTRDLSNRLIDIINQNIGKLLLNNNITLKSELSTISNILFVNDIVNISLTDRFYGNINPNSYIIKDDTISDLIINIEFMLSPYERVYKKLNNNKIEHVIEHEFLHVVEQYLTVSDNNKLSSSWEIDMKLKYIQNKYNSATNWKEISYFIYLSLPHEIRARVQQLNKDIEQSHITGIKNVMVYIKNTKIYKDLEFLSNLDENILLDKLKQDIEHVDILKDFNDISKSTSNNYEQNFLNYIKKMKKKNQKLLNKLLKTSYNFDGTYYDDSFVINYNEFEK
jgi:hypothetical protein